MPDGLDETTQKIADVDQAIRREAAVLADDFEVYAAPVPPEAVQDAKMWFRQFALSCLQLGIELVVPHVTRNEDDFELTWESETDEFHLNRLVILIGTTDCGVRDYGHVLRGPTLWFDPRDLKKAIEHYESFLAERT
jgi:hypothetical protein